MFYYLLFNSSFIKSNNLKEKLISTIIYSSFVYIIIHALISFKVKLKPLLKYFWGILIIDIFTLFFKSEENLFYILIESSKKDNNLIEKQEEVEPEIQQKLQGILVKNNKKLNKKHNKKNNKPIINKSIDFEAEEILEFDKNEPVCDLKLNNTDEIIDLKNENDKEIKNNEVNNLNLTLNNLEKLNKSNEIDIPDCKNNNLGSSNIKDLKNIDEFSEPASSTIDLVNFEKSIMGN